MNFLKLSMDENGKHGSLLTTIYSMFAHTLSGAANEQIANTE